MGARQRGQHKRKQQGRGGGIQNSPRVPQNGSNSTVQVRSLDPSSRAQIRHGWQAFSDSVPSAFSLRDEARHTDRHTASWLSEPLRGRGIAFVSAGTLTREEPPEPEQHEEHDNTRVASEETVLQSIEEFAQTPEQENGADEDSSSKDEMHPEGEMHTQPAEQHAELELRQRKNSISTESSDEVIFVGRGKASTLKVSETTETPDQPHVQAAVPYPQPAPNGAASQKPTLKSLPGITFKQQAISEQGSTQSTIPDQISRQPAVVNAQAKPRSGPDAPAFKAVKHTQRPVNSHSRRRVKRSTDELDEEEAIMQDYINNLAISDDNDEEAETSEGRVQQNEHHRFYNAAIEEHVNIKSVGIRGGRQSDLDQAIDWSSADLEDFDDISTTDEEVIEVEQVLRKRERPAGLQYLVHEPGRNTSEAKWVSHEKLVSTTAKDEIRIFEEVQEMRLQIMEDDLGETSTSDEDEEALNDLVDNIESEDEENARIVRLVATMTDEQIARAIAKQEELGMGGDELMIFDGQEEDDSNEADEFQRGDGFIPFSFSKHTSNRTRTKKNKRSSANFPSAEAFADALDEDPDGAFDLMDFDRPSLKPKKKGRKGGLPFELAPDDSDLAEQLQSSWAKDRDKKVARKREKAAARAAMSDLAIGNDPESIKSAVRSFLVDENRDSLPLPTMPPHVRASVHRLAKALSLNSRSEGKGDDRYPVLTKTPRTPHYSPTNIWEIDAMMNQRRYFPKNMNAYKNGSTRAPLAGGTTRPRRGGGGILAGASYMDGEVVGAAAPELGADNKGREMLMKMGWQAGMGIGAIGNQGSIEVIKHVVKNTKAGLG